MTQLLTIGQAAERLGVSVDVLRAAEDRNEIKSTRTPGGHRRFRLEDVDALKRKWAPSQTAPKRNAWSESITRPPARVPVPQARQSQYEPIEEFEAEPLAFGERVTIREPERAVVAKRAEEEARTREAAAEAERKRLLGLKEYGQELMRWTLLPADVKAEVVADLEANVTAQRFPAWVPEYQAREFVKGRVDAIVKRHKDEKDRQAKEEQEDRRIDALISSAMSYARSETVKWDTADQRAALRDIERVLDDEVEPDWLDADARRVVDEELADWEEDEPDAED
jgi:excisionase family DNA binding protein